MGMLRGQVLDGPPHASFLAATEGAAYEPLLDAFIALHGATPPPSLDVAWFDLWGRVREEFESLNSTAAICIVDDSTETVRPSNPHDERRVAAYLAGWALRKALKMARKRKCDSRFVPLLERLLGGVGCQLPANEVAAGYLEARQQFQKLYIPTTLLITAFAVARHSLAEHLDFELFRSAHKLSSAYERAVVAMRKDPAVCDAFAAALRCQSGQGAQGVEGNHGSDEAESKVVISLWLSELVAQVASAGGEAHSEDEAEHETEASKTAANSLGAEATLAVGKEGLSDEEKVVAVLLRRLTNSAGRETCKQIVALTGVEREEGNLAIRSRLKFEQMKTASADAKSSAHLNPKAHLSMSPALAHQVLSIVALENPTALAAPSVSIPLMQAILCAYTCADTDIQASLLKEKAKKKDLQDALVKAISNNEDFKRFSLITAALAKVK